MKLDIPFYPMPKEKATYCGQYVLKCVFKYLLNKEYDEEYLAKISEKFGNGATLSSGLVYAALHEGLKIKFITKTADIDFSQLHDSKKLYDENSTEYVQLKSNELFGKIRKLNGTIEVREPGLEELIDSIDKKNPVVVLIDYGKIDCVNRQIFHFVTLCGHDEKNIYFHDVGPTNPIANVQVEKDIFYKAWSAFGTDMDTIIFHK